MKLILLSLCMLFLWSAPQSSYSQPSITGYPGSVCFIRYDSVGIPPDLAQKRLLFIEIDNKEIALPSGVNRQAINRLDAYPFELEVIKREDLFKRMQGRPLQAEFDYQLRLGASGSGGLNERYYAIIENLHTHTRYRPDLESSVFFGKSVKAFVKMIRKGNAPTTSPSQFLLKGIPCESDEEAGELRSIFPPCLEIDYFTLPDDLDQRGIALIEVSEKDYPKPAFINNRFGEGFVEKYPFEAKLFSTSEASVPASIGYQVRFGQVRQKNQYTIHQVYTDGSYGYTTIQTDEDKFILILEDLETGERYAFRTIPAVPFTLQRFFLQEIDRQYK